VANQRHLKNNDMELSYLQERILDALYMLTVKDMQRRDTRLFSRVTYFRGRGIKEVIGGAWSTFRKREVDKLISLGWVEKVSVMGTGWCYSLTESGFGTLDGRIGKAASHSEQLWHDENQEQPDMFAAREVESG